MHSRSGTIHLSASDLANHLACRHLTHLDRQAAERHLEPPSWRDPLLEVLQQRGFEHERAYLEQLRGQGRLDVLRVHDDEFREGESAFQRTRAAMHAGTDVIVQAVLESQCWYGRADVLLKVASPSQLGAWSYEVVDTKLARNTRAGTILQLCFYSAMVGEIQGAMPARMHVVSPGTGFEPETYRLEDYLAYYRFVKGRLWGSVQRGGSNGGRTYPDPTLQCDICRWWRRCDTQRRQDDHLCLVAGMGRSQQRELHDWGILTLADLAALPVPIQHHPQRGSRETYERLREQARLQLQARRLGDPTYELLPVEPGQGLARLPEPSPGDVFLDLEGDPFVGTSGQDYLFGCAVLDQDGSPTYRSLWAWNPAEEKTGFEALVQFVLERWERHPGMHIYHYAPYEPSAFKRIMGRYGTQEDAVDRLLRAERFVDLYAVVKRALRAGVEKYSIKDLEPLYGFQRDVDLRRASASLRALEHALETGQGGGIEPALRATVESYNRDDCLSAWRLRHWLESLRTGLIEQGQEIPRPALEEGDASEALDERRQRVQELAARLTTDVPVALEDRSPVQHARWLLAQMLEWHRREAKAPWWEYYRLLELSNEELLEERAALSGLQFVGRLDCTRRIPTDRYTYPHQENLIQRKAEVHTTDGKHFGKVEDVDVVARTIDIKKTRATAELHPLAIFEHTVYRTEVQEDSLLRLAQWVLEHGIDSRGAYRAARDLLLRIPPRLRHPQGKSRGFGSAPLPSGSAAHGCAGRGESTGSPPLQQPGESTLDAAKRLGLALDRGVLPVQGPPGSGKTHAGARMIVELVQEGKQVGVTAMSHAVIRNLLQEVERAATEAGVRLQIVQKPGSDSHEGATDVIRMAESNEDVEKALRDGSAQVVGGTSWLWSRSELFESVDVLVVDEAGQMSLANVLAVAQSGKTLVLIGDPQQLEQPQKGTHPEGADASALEHLIQDPFQPGRRAAATSSPVEPAQTVPPDRGLFLAETWRLHPSICTFTSELFYEGRLRSRRGLETQAIRGAIPILSAGLWFVPVEHEGNRSSSPEEVDAVARLVHSLLGPGVLWVDAGGQEQPLRREHLLIVAPYNAQVAAMGERLPGVRVGTVDKFQGQEAPVVIYSMTTSTSEEAPRGMEFLYSLNRLNVATSRARGACILVANPKLLEPECRTPRQIRLANAFCRYLELAATVDGFDGGSPNPGA